MRPDEPIETRVLILAARARDGALIEGLLGRARIGAKVSADLEELRADLPEGAGAVLLTEEVLTSEAVDELGEVFSAQLPWSDLPLLVFSSGGPMSEPLRRLKAVTAFTLLDRPTRKATVVSAVQAALRARRRQYEVRDLLLELGSNVRARDQFLAMLSHELRNPLAAIMTSVQLMEQRSPEAVPMERTVVHRQARLLARLVDDLLDVSRVTLGKIALERTPLDASALLERSVQSFAAAARAQDIELTLELPDRPFVVEGDGVRLEQVIGNLLRNALKYTPAGGHVAVAASVRGGEGEIRISDDGVGISPEALPRIFDPFMQDERALDRSQGGLGIGLTLARNLVTLHGGTVTASSRGPGLGAAFSVRLPAISEDRLPESALRARREAPHLRRSVLVIEDNTDIREGLKSLLEGAGHEVEVSPDGAGGIEIAREIRPEVVFVDIGLPRLDGYSVARLLRRALGKRVRLVALTGYGSAEDRERALQAGFDEHITKPTSLRVLERILDSASETSRALSR